MKLICNNCNNEFERSISVVNLNKKRGQVLSFCSVKCKGIYSRTEIAVKCDQCNKIFIKKNGQIKKSRSGNNFCSRSCAGTYNNLHKTKGNRRSKLEQQIEKQLIIKYPDIVILFNNKDVIGSELDIFIPIFNLAFELNGIYHYEPIHGDSKLTKIQTNDKNKFKLCIDKNISLCIIDVTKQKYFKEKTSQEFLDIIINIINENMMR